MVVCKFFQQGYCRFGQGCRFEHIYGSKYSYHSNSPAPAAQSEITDEQLAQQVQTDVQSALKGGQWLLSVYAPYKDKPNLPGLSDLSPDEARLFIYEAEAKNTLDQALAYINNLQQEAAAKYNLLLQPTPNLLKVLRTLYKGETPQSPFSGDQQTSALFGNSTNNAASSVFRSAVQNNSIFGQNAASPQSIFGTQAGSNSVFGAPNPGNTAAQSIFAQANQSVFSNNQASAQANPTSIFASASQKLFGSPTSTPFAQPQSTSPFTNTNAQSPQSHSVFGQTAGGATNSPFGQASPANVFAQANADGFFGQKPANSAVPSGMHSQFPNSVFGPSKGNIFEQKAASNDQGVYSLMEDLSAEDLEAFKSDSFSLGCIPKLPPPHSLCI